MKKSFLTVLFIALLTVAGLAMPAAAYADTGTCPAGGTDPNGGSGGNPPAVSIDEATVTGVQDRYAYTGRQITPAPVVTVFVAPNPASGSADPEGVVLTEGIDYLVSYADADGVLMPCLFYAGQCRLVIEGIGDYTGRVEIPLEIYMAKGWRQVDGKWYYYSAENVMKTNGWAKDSKGWCWLGSDGAVTEDQWIKDGGEWYYIKKNGYMAANEWAKDSKGWMWLDKDGHIVKSRWLKDGGEWYYIKSNGYMAANEWEKDSKGWMYMNSSGRITKSKWVRTDGKWYYLKADGYMDKTYNTGINKLGCPYVYGASGPYAFDCSGFVMWVMRQQGIYLPHNAAGQYNALASKNIGTDWHNAQVGDLVFYSYGGPGSSHHVGIYAGDGQLLHASSTHGGVVITSVNYTNGHIAAICRP